MNKRIKKKQLKKASKLVLDELQKRCLFRGEYSGEPEAEVFIDGIWTVIEQIAFFIGEDEWLRISNEFCHNMIESEEKFINDSRRT